MAARFSKPGQWGNGFAEMIAGKPRWTGKVELQRERLLLPMRWRVPAKIFACSASDPFHESLSDEDIAQIFATMAAAYWHTFQVLTKRAERAQQLVSSSEFRDMVDGFLSALDDDAQEIGLVDVLARRTDDWRANVPDVQDDQGWPLPNVWLGVSTEDQETADERIPFLLRTPAAKHFLSCEPLLGPIDLEHLPSISGIGRYLDALGYIDRHSDVKGGVDWVICGGESGPHARPMHPDWARSLRNQCADAGVSFFFKQWGEWGRVGDQDVDHLPEDADVLTKVGKGRAGRLLDGVEHNGFPVATL